MTPHGKKPGLLIVIGKSKGGLKDKLRPKKEGGGPMLDEPMDDDMGGDEGGDVGTELGHGLADAIHSGDGKAIYDAVEAIVRECERAPHEEGPHLGGEGEEEEAY